MFNKKMIISGIVSGIMLAASSIATPASAGQAIFNLETGIESLLNELIGSDESAPKAQNIEYRRVPIRKIHRKMRRRGLYPISDYRVRGDRVIIRAEDDDGTLYRVVADADYGDILKIRRVRATSNYRRLPVEPRYYDDGYDNYRPNYRPNNRPNNRRNYGSTHAERKARKDAAARAHAKRKAANRTHAQRKAANARAHAARKAAKIRAQNNRRAAQGAQARNHAARNAAKARNHAARKAAQARADRNRRASAGSRRDKKPYVAGNPEKELLLNGSGR